MLKKSIILFFALAVLILVSCKKENTIDATLLPGVWQIDGTEQFLNFHTDGTGAFWDEADDVYEDDVEVDGNGWFKWELTNDALSINFTIFVSGGSVPKSSTVTKLTGTQMTWRDSFKNETHLTRKPAADSATSTQ